MAKTNKQSRRNSNELDSAYILKLVLYLIIGAQWLRFVPTGNLQIPIPIGAIVGIFFAAHEHFVIDRKIEYAVLLVAMFIGFWFPVGFDIVL